MEAGLMKESSMNFHPSSQLLARRVKIPLLKCKLD